MGKIVKFCSTCEESFAEKFGFCPTCGATLQAFEMNPLADAPAVTPEPEIVTAPEIAPAEVLEFNEPAPTEVFAAGEVADIDDEVDTVVHEEFIAAPEEPQVIATPPAPVFIQTTALDADAISDRPMVVSPVEDDGFGVTVIEEDNGKRNGLLLGASSFMVALLMFGLVYSIFSKDTGIDSLDDGMFNAVILDNPEMTVEKEEIQKKDDDDGGGGGGGGKNESEPASAGVRPPMLRTVTFPPSAHMERLTNPDIKIQMAVQGPRDETTKDPNQRYGVDTSNIGTISDGPGTGGGIGTGRGTGAGSGTGTGAGSGTGSGLGGGIGGGIGDDTGPGTGGARTPPPARVGVTEGLKIISKPRAGYTDSARQNNVTGKVVLRITFLANGSVGSITPVSGLGYGLTEQAIAAARRIVFTPAKVNGVAQTTTKTFEYGFSIY